jgi:hypothetical protein
LKSFFKVVVILNITTSPSSSSDNNGFVGRIESLEVVNDFFVVFDGVEVFVQNKVEGGVLVLGVVDVGDRVGVLENFGHFLPHLAAASYEQYLFHLIFRFLFIFCLYY